MRRALILSALLVGACVPADLHGAMVLLATMALLGCGAYWSLFCSDEGGR